jgi:hypothetical protein
MMATQHTLPIAGTSVPEIQSKTATTDNKWRRYRLKKQRDFQGSGEAFLYTECLHCAKKIKPTFSFSRGFCAGGQCRKEYRKAVPIHRVVPIFGIDRRVSTQVCALRSVQV